MNTAWFMRQTLAALVPGTAVMTWYFGAGILINLVLCMTFAAATEAVMLKCRRRPVASLKDGSALLTGALLGLCLPPLVPLHVAALGVMFALIFGKHLYGGTGQNLFNPAMLGFAVLIVSFPLSMSLWPDRGAAIESHELFSSKLGRSAQPDGITAATPLDAYRLRQGMTNQEFFQDHQQQNLKTWATISLAFAAGGLYLVFRRIIPWRTPVAFIGTLIVLSVVFYDGGSSASLGSPYFHLMTGATMLAAFFVVTDPVTCPAHPLGLLVFGMGVGLVTFIIRSVGAYPEGIAFGVLLMNAVSPLIDHLLADRGAVS